MIRRILLAALALAGLSRGAEAACSAPNYYSGLFHEGCLAAVDLNNNNTAIYAAIASGGGNYLPKTGGTLTGALIGTTGTFAGGLLTTPLNASQLLSGTVPAARLPNPSASTLGGVQSKAAVTNQWINSISTAGVPSATQPAFSNLSGQATLAQFPTIANNTLIGNVVGTSAVPTAVTRAQATALMFPAGAGMTTNRTLADWFGDVWNVQGFGVKNDMVTGADGVISAGSSVLSSASIACDSAVHPGMRFEMNGVGATITGNPLSTTVSSCSGSNFQLAATATVASGRSFLNLARGINNTTITGNYQIGDQISFVGGDVTGGTATVLQVIALQATGTVAIVSAGSGGTDGTYTFQGTTGTGKKIQVRGTVTGGVLVSVSQQGNSGYIVAPTNTADTLVDPTGRNPLAGATISYQLGISQASIVTRGNYLTVPASPIATTAGSLSGATGTTYTPSFVTTNTFVLGTDNTAALSTAITTTIAKMNAAGSFSRRTLYFPAGNYLINGSELPLITRPIMVLGDGQGQTQIYAGALYAGAHVLGFSELFGQTENAPQNALIYQMGQLDWGAGARGISFYGNLSASNIPDAIVLYGRNTDMIFRDLAFDNIGIGISAGRLTANQKISYWRESSASFIRSRGAGRANKGVIDLDSIGDGGATNELSFFKLDLVFSRGNAIRFANHNTGERINQNTRITDFRAEAQSGDPNATMASLVQIGNDDDLADIGFIDINRAWLVNPPLGAAAVTLTGRSAATIPHDISLNGIDIGGGKPLGKGINILAGYNIDVEISRNDTWDALIAVAPSNTLERANAVLRAGSTTTDIVLDASASSVSGAYINNVLVLSTSALVTATVSGTTMTVSAVTSGTLAVGQQVYGNGIGTANTIASFGTGTGGTGTYILSTAATVASPIDVSAFLVESRLVTAYNTSTKVATVGSLHGSPAGFSTAPAVGKAYVIEQLIGRGYLYFNGYGQESTWVTSIGTGATSYLSSSPFISGSLASGGTRTFAPNLALSGSISFVPTSLAAYGINPFMANRRDVTMLATPAACDGTTNDTTALNAAAAPAMLPIGSCFTSASAASLTSGAWHSYFGGYITSVESATNRKQSPHYSRITSQPTQTGGTSFIFTAYDADWSKNQFPWQTYVTGAATAQQPSSGYVFNPLLAGFHGWMQNSSGWNQSTSIADGRTEVSMYRGKMVQTGLGDTFVFFGDVFVNGAKPGATSFLPNPAGALLGGQVLAGQAGVYLQGLGDINTNDMGFDVAAIGLVLNNTRGVATGALGATHMAIRMQTKGTRPYDAMVSGAGATIMGVDLVPATFANYTLASIAIAATGSSCAANDVVTLSTGTALDSATTQITVDTVSGGAIATWHVTRSGMYSSPPTGTVASTASGSCTGSTWAITYGNNAAVALPVNATIYGNATDVSTAKYPNTHVLGARGKLEFLSGTLQITGHVATKEATAPAATSCGGGSPAVVGTDTAGEVTMGTSATGCVITFATAYTAAPFCVVTWQATPLASQSYANDNVAITLTQTSTSGNKVNWHCIARAGG